MKKQTVIALILLLLIPVVAFLGGLLFSLVNPEIAAGHPNYVFNYRILTLVKNTSLLASFVVIVILWFLGCLFLIRSKGRSSWWLLLAALGPFGFAFLATLDSETPGAWDRHAKFVRGLNSFVRVGYEMCRFLIIGLLAFEIMLLKRTLMILYESATTGISTAQIVDRQNASSGMWAFSEGLEVMFIAVLLYLIWPAVFNILAHVASIVSSKVRQSF